MRFRWLCDVSSFEHIFRLALGKSHWGHAMCLGATATVANTVMAGPRKGDAAATPPAAQGTRKNAGSPVGCTGTGQGYRPPWRPTPVPLGPRCVLIPTWLWARHSRDAGRGRTDAAEDAGMRRCGALPAPLGRTVSRGPAPRRCHAGLSPLVREAR